ncbi:DUF4227 family protein [Effusibacillus pohliae]|uniref:DUF4227 family protein n=1 Tax=Effusibacillus pohliae TaxID=232270 RepID=UPI000363559C|nr:DUF4227 family protein [Effusibacillus pohliae]
MVFSVWRLLRWVQMVVLVCLFSFVLFKMMEIVHVWMQPVDKYKQPKGNSLKVNGDFDLEQPVEDVTAAIIERLKMFYRLGE